MILSRLIGRCRFPTVGNLRHRRFQRLELALVVLAACAVAASAQTPATNAPATTNGVDRAVAIENTRTLLGKWFETQQAMARERREWLQAREVLQARIDVLKREVADYDDKMGKARQKLDDAEKARAGIFATNDALKAAATNLAVSVGQLEGRVRELHARMPEPFLPRAAQLFERMPKDPAATRVSVAERFQNVLGILNEMNKFNTEIPLAYEVRNLSDGKPAEVKAFYLGLAQAWFVSAGGEAGVGAPGEQGWQWQPASADAEKIRQAIDVLQNKGTPAFIPLSMSLR